MSLAGCIRQQKSTRAPHRKRIGAAEKGTTHRSQSCWIGLGRQVKERWLKWRRILENLERKTGLSQHYYLIGIAREKIAATERRGR